MENNKSEFKATGVYFDGARAYEIQIARSGDAARRKHDTLCLNSKQNGTALLRRMHNISRCGKKRYSWNSIKRNEF